MSFSEEDLSKMGLKKDKDGNYFRPKSKPQPREKSSAERVKPWIIKEDVDAFRKFRDEGASTEFFQRVEVKPMSVNAAWKGHRVKTDEYKAYEQGVLSILFNVPVPQPPYRLTLNLGVSNPASDIDNPVKLFIDILQKKYQFNDKEIYELNVKKIIVGKRREYCEFKLETIV